MNADDAYFSLTDVAVHCLCDVSCVCSVVVGVLVIGILNQCYNRELVKLLSASKYIPGGLVSKIISIQKLFKIALD